MNFFSLIKKEVEQTPVSRKNCKIKFSDLKSAIGASTRAKGASGDKGMKGEPSPRGLDGV